MLLTYSKLPARLICTSQTNHMWPLTSRPAAASLTSFTVPVDALKKDASRGRLRGGRTRLQVIQTAQSIKTHSCWFDIIGSYSIVWEDAFSWNLDSSEFSVASALTCEHMVCLSRPSLRACSEMEISFRMQQKLSSLLEVRQIQLCS